MPIPAGSVLLIQVRGRLHQQRVMNNFYYATLTSSSDNLANNTVSSVEKWDMDFGPMYAACMSNEVTNLTIRGQILQPNGTAHPDRFMFYEQPASDSEGAVVQNSLPSTVSAVVRRRTALSGRKYRGRVYVPGVPFTWEIDSVLTEAAQDTLIANMGAILITPMTVSATIWQPVVTDSPFFLRQTVVNAAAVDPVLRVQRRREIGVGE